MRVWALHRRAAAWAEGNLCPPPALGPSEVLRMRGMDQGRPGSPHCKGRSSCPKRTQGWGRRPGSALSLLSCHQSHAGTPAQDAQVLASSLGHILHPSLGLSDHGCWELTQLGMRTKSKSTFTRDNLCFCTTQNQAGWFFSHRKCGKCCLKYR